MRGLSEANRVAIRSASVRSPAAASWTVQGLRGAANGAGSGSAAGTAGDGPAAGAGGCGDAGVGAGFAAGEPGAGSDDGSGGGGGAGLSFVRRSWKVSGSGFVGVAAGARSSASRSPGRGASPPWRAPSCFPTFRPRTNTRPRTTSAPTTIEATCLPSSESWNFSRGRTRRFPSRIGRILGPLAVVASFRTLHPVGRRDAEDREAVREHLPEREAEEQAPRGLPRIRADHPLAGLLPLRVIRVEGRDGLLQPEGDPVRLVRERRAGDEVRERGDPADEVLLLRRDERARRLEVEVGLRVGAPGEEDEPRRVASDLVHHLAQPDDVAGALPHLHGLAAAGEVHHLDEDDVEVGRGVAERLERRLEPRDVPAVVRAEHVYQGVGPLPLLPVVGDVGAEVGRGAVRLLHRPVHLVAEPRRAEEREVVGGRDALLVRLLRHLPRRAARRALLRLRGRELADVDEPLRLEVPEEALHRPALIERLLRGPNVERDVDRAEIAADQLEHEGDRAIAEGREPLRLGRVQVAVADLRADRPRDVDHVLARVPLRRKRHRPARELLVAQVDRARERLHLRAEVVHVVLAGDLVAAPGEQAGHRVPGDGIPPVADVHRAGRVRRDVLDVDPLSLPDPGSAPRGTSGDRALEGAEPDVRREPHVDEAGAGDLEADDLARGVLRADLVEDRLRELARRLPGSLGEHHRRVHREITVLRVAGRLDREGGPAGGPAPVRGPLLERPAEDLDDAITDHMEAASYRAPRKGARRHRTGRPPAPAPGSAPPDYPTLRASPSKMSGVRLPLI